MKFRIPCETFCRIASVVSFFEPRTPLEIRAQIECVRLEIHKGKMFAIATNQQIAVIEYVDDSPQPDGVAHVVVDPALIAQCETEKAYNSFLEVTTIPEIATATASTMYGFTYKGNACIWPDKTVMDEWRNWGPDNPALEFHGALYLETDHIHQLFLASPSGRIIFPSFINVNEPVVLRDRKNPNWVGLFLGRPPITENEAKPAVLPDWWRE